MDQRIDYAKIAPDALKAMMAVEAYITASVDHTIRHLVKVRASQVNGCAFCIDMHWKQARADGETEQRLYGLDAWRESPYYSDRERAALAWTEALTNVSATHAPDADFALAREHFSEKELVDISWAIAAINTWNRMAIGMRAKAGSFPAPRPRAAAPAATA